MEDNTNVQGDGKTHDDTRDSSETLSDMSLTSSSNNDLQASSPSSESSSPRVLTSRRGGGRRKGKPNWTADEDAWLANQIMKNVSTAWLKANLPGDVTRSVGSLNQRVANLRKKGVIPRRWRDPYSAAVDGAPWTMAEDIEIMQWHAWGREHIDAKVFIGNNRSGEAVRMRADYLCQDEDLIDIVKAIEQNAREATCELDLVRAEGAPQESVDEEMRDVEWMAEEAIRQAIWESLARRDSYL